MGIAAYYNEFDSKAAAWLRQLIKNRDITNGDVDDRSITEVTANDLKGYNRIHFFAGIGTWDYALNQAGWGYEPVWTASLPCQPFSVAGKGLGKSDERHLLPHFIELVRQCRPATIFGEQVPGAIKHGWLDDLYAEMEACGYAVGSIIIGAHSVGAAHIRQRLYWMAHAKTAAWHGGVLRSDQGAYCGEFNGMGNAVDDSCERKIGCGDGETQSGEIGDRKIITIAGQSCGTSSDVCGLSDPNNARSQGRSGIECADKLPFGESGMVNRLGNASGNNKQWLREPESATDIPGCEERQGVDWIYCRDGKYRPIKPGIQPLVDGAAEKLVHCGDTSASINANATQEARSMRLKGYGNAIHAQTAEIFVRACMTN